MLGRASNCRRSSMDGSDDRQGARPQGRSGVTCDQCGAVCPSAIHLARHLVLHDDDGPAKPKITYTCASCNRKFRFLKQLTGHRETCRGDARGSSLARSAGGVSATAAAATAASSTFQCGVCDRQFTQCGALRRHERMHSGERPHACQACGKRFTQKCTLDRHMMLVHDGIVGGGSGGTDETVRSLRQSRGGRGTRGGWRGNRRGGGDSSLVAAASAAADGAAGTVSSQLQSRGRRGRLDGDGSAVAASFAFDRSRRTPSPPSLFSDEEGDDLVNSDSIRSMAGTFGADNAHATGSNATSSLATDSFDDKDDRKHVTSEESTSSSSSSESGDNGGVDSDSDASPVTSAGAADDPRRQHKCARCGLAFKLAAHLKQHVVALHSGGKRPYACDKCDQRYHTQGALHSHKVMHSKKMRYRCHKCGCRFPRKWSLQRHVLKHRLKPAHRCLLCGQRFSQVENLELHLRSTHAGERPHRCTECDSRFATAAKLRRHASTVHSTRTASTMVSRQSKRPVPNDLGAVPRAVAAGGVAALGAKLAQTDASFMPDAKRRRRVEPVSGNSKSDVSIASAAGRSRSKANASGTVSASRRTTIASGMTPETKDSFVCRMCSSSFDCKRNLTRHEQAHIAPRLHGCLQCGRCFTQRGNLNRHVRKVHQRPADKSSATAAVSRSQTSNNDGGNNVDRSVRASVVADRRKPRTLGNAGQAESGSKDGAHHMVAGSQAKAVNASKGGQRLSTRVSGEAGRTANTGAVEIASHGCGTTASGISNVDGQRNAGDGFTVDGLRSEIIVGCDLVPFALSSPPCNSNKISPSTTALESSAASDGGPLEHGLSLNVGDAVIGRRVKPSLLELWWERECVDEMDRPNSPLELIVAEMELGSSRLPSLESDGGAVDHPLSSTVCQVLPGRSDVVGSSEMQALCRQSSVADSPRSGSSPACSRACIQLPLVKCTASTSVRLGSGEASGAQLTPSDADSPRSGGSSGQCAALARVEHVASTSVAPDSESSGAQLTSSSSVCEVIDDDGRQVQEMSTGGWPKESHVASVNNLYAWFVEENAEECVDGASKPRSAHSDDIVSIGGAIGLWEEILELQ